LIYPNADKIGHVGVAAGLAFALNLGFIGRKPLMGRFRMPVGSLLTLVLMTVEEVSQVLFARRSFEWVDLGCNVLGICLGSLFMRLVFISGRGRRVDKRRIVGFGRGAGE